MRQGDYYLKVVVVFFQNYPIKMMHPMSQMIHHKNISPKNASKLTSFSVLNVTAKPKVRIEAARTPASASTEQPRARVTKRILNSR
jgi:hypothetical protein